MFETSQSGTWPLDVAEVLPPLLGQPVALVGLLSPHPLPRHIQSCCIDREEGSGISQQIGSA